MADGGDRKSGVRTQKAFADLVGFVANAVRIIGALFAAILVLQIIFTVFSANPQNGIVMFVADLSRPLTLGFDNLFTPANPKLAVFINYAIAAVVWLVVTQLIAKVLRRVVG